MEKSEVKLQIFMQSYFDNSFFLAGDARQAQDVPLPGLWKDFQRSLQPDEAHARAHWSQTFRLQGFAILMR